MINILPTEVVRLIAAGEVIDSWAGAVRELSENAIDSGADRIVISMGTDNLTLQVTDNGTGISYADLMQVALAHTTSKIAHQQDLYQISTLGFRGEALHCLAQLGELSIISRQGSKPAYSCAYNHQGKCLEMPQETAFANGTTVKVANLFANYPQRLLMLPPIPQQLRQVQKQIYHLAIANPQVSWQIFLDQKEWLKIWSDHQLKQIVAQIIPNLNTQALIEANKSHLHLVISAPDRYHRPRPDWVKIIINQRVVNHPELEQTILNSYQKTLPRHRFPLCIVHLRVPPQQVDWNRHPAKSEVYIDQLKYWQKNITDTIAELLQKPSALNSNPKLFRVAETAISYSSANTIKAIAHVLKTYILAEGQQGIYLIEQHTAHERILYENIEDQWQNVPISEALLFNNLQEEQVTHLTNLGIDISEFGNNLWVVRSLPKLLINHPEQIAILEELSQQKDLTTTMAQLACRTAIKNGTDLDQSIMQNLIQQWQATRHPHTCPHGRPICLRLEDSDLARIFRRNWLIGN